MQSTVFHFQSGWFSKKSGRPNDPYVLCLQGKFREDLERTRKDTTESSHL